MKPIPTVLGLALLMSCANATDMQQAQHIDTIYVEGPETKRVLEDVPVEDRRLLNDSLIIIPKASKRTAHTSAALSRHKAEEPKSEIHTYYLVAGSFASEEEASLMVNFFETEGIEAMILPYKNMKRVALKLTMQEKKARQQMDSLNQRFDGLVEFWFLHDQ